MASQQRMPPRPVSAPDPAAMAAALAAQQRIQQRIPAASPMTMQMQHRGPHDPMENNLTLDVGELPHIRSRLRGCLRQLCVFVGVIN